MRIQKWIKTAAVFVCAAGITVSAFGMIHAAGQEPAAEPVLPTIQEQTDTVYAGSAPEQDATILGQEKRLLPPCGVSDDADKLSLFVSFQVLESSAEGCRLQIRNYSAQHLLTTEYVFSLEVKKDGTYVPAVYHTAPCWPDIACIVEPGGTAELRFDWHASYGTLLRGEYRIVTEYFSETSVFTQKTPFTVL